MKYKLPIALLASLSLCSFCFAEDGTTNNTNVPANTQPSDTTIDALKQEYRAERKKLHQENQRFRDKQKEEVQKFRTQQHQENQGFRANLKQEREKHYNQMQQERQQFRENHKRKHR